MFSTLSSVIGHTNVALKGANEIISSASDLATINSSLYSQSSGTSIAAASTKLVADITYDRVTTTAAVSVGATAEATATAFSAGLAGTEVSLPSGPLSLVVGAAAGVGTYAYLNNSTVREGLERGSSDAVSSVFNAYNGAMQRGAEAYRDVERAIYDLYGQPYPN